MPRTQEAATYEVRVKGRLTEPWLRRFERMQFAYREGDICIVGPVADQAALEGLLISIGDLALTLRSVCCLEEVT